MATIIGNLFSAGAFLFGIIGFLFVWKQFSSVRDADKQKRNFYAANPTASHFPLARLDYEAEYYAMAGRAELAELAAQVAHNELVEAKGSARDAAEEAAYAAEDAQWEADRKARHAAEDAGEALLNAAE